MLCEENEKELRDWRCFDYFLSSTLSLKANFTYTSRNVPQQPWTARHLLGVSIKYPHCIISWKLQAGQIPDVISHRSWTLGKGSLDTPNRFFMKRVVGHWNSLPREVVTAPSLPEFKQRLDNVLKSYGSALVGPARSRGVVLSDPYGSFPTQYIL